MEESIFWSLLGPLLLFSSLAALHFALALRSSYQMKHTMARHAQLRRLLWLQALWLPLLCVQFTLAVYAANHTQESAFQALSGLSLAIGAGVLAVNWFSNRSLRSRMRRSLSRLAGRPMSSESLAGTRTSVLLHSKQQLSAQQLAGQSPAGFSGYGLPAGLMLAGSVATLPAASGDHLEARWNSNSVLHDPADRFNASLEELDASTTTTTSRSTASRQHRAHTAKRRTKRRQAGSQSGGDLARMLHEPENYIDPCGYFSYDNDDGSRRGAESVASGRHRRRGHRHGRHGKHRKQSDTRLDEHEDPYAIYVGSPPGDQPDGGSADQLNLALEQQRQQQQLLLQQQQAALQAQAEQMDRAMRQQFNARLDEAAAHQMLGHEQYQNVQGALDAQDGLRSGTLQRTLHQQSGQLLDRMMDASASNYALYQVPQSLAAPAGLYSNTLLAAAAAAAASTATAGYFPPAQQAGHDQSVSGLAGSRANEPFNRANILSMMQPQPPTQQQLAQQQAQLQQQLYGAPRLVDYSIRDEEDELEQPPRQPGHAGAVAGSLHSGSLEMNNEVTEIVENI